MEILCIQGQQDLQQNYIALASLLKKMADLKKISISDE